MSDPDETTASDPGLQVERTTLAWQRTAMSVAVVGALLLHAGRDTHWAAAPAALGIAMTLGLLAFGNRHASRAEGLIRAGKSPMAPTVNTILSMSVTVLALASIIVLTLDRG